MQLQDGEYTIIFGAHDEKRYDEEDIIHYKIKGEEVSKEEYENLLNSNFDTTKAEHISDQASYDFIIKFFESLKDLE